ncbi:MAG: MFS transporter [Bdellovibrionaceae bacterium]|nr:MFS transporter [Pseudobdellovibrionaceae bacterium]
MSFKLIFKERQFAGLYWTQFLGAVNDNLLKNALVVMMTFKGAQIADLAASQLVALAGALFILPYFLFSPLAGQLSDKLDKARLVRLTKWWELAIMIVGVCGFVMESYPLLLFVLFLMGTQSTFFGPMKYSMIPQIVREDELMSANAHMELGTFLAILLGTIAGGLVVASDAAVLLIGTALLVISALGLFTAYWLSPVTPGNPALKIQYNPIPTFGEMWRLIREREAVFNSVLAVSWFWFFGAGLLSILPIYCKEYLNVDESVVTAFLTMFTLGIGVGSLLCEKLSKTMVEIGLVPLGSLGMSVFLLDLVFVAPSWDTFNAPPLNLSAFLATTEGPRLLADFLGCAIFGGFFIVPLFALLQERSHPESRSQVIAANNVMNAIFMVASSLMLMVFYAWKLTLPEMFLIFTTLNLVVAVYVYSVVPEFTLRFLSYLLRNLLYRVRVTGHDNIPRTGGVILAANHVSFIDWLLILASVRRPVRFVMYYKFFDIPFVRHLMRQAKVIPIAGKNEDPAILENAFTQIAKELGDGEVVCIFPEGRITDDGEIQELRPGLLKMLSSTPVPVVPLGINNVWGSLFSRAPDRRVLKRPTQLWRRIELKIGRPLTPQEVTLEKLDAEIRKLRPQA